ncbi:CopG family antitoxin [Hymenobacter terricola]|nr:ribbon-helix-helix protein, CopG family [Hymenobacter terricola]
MKTTTTKEEKRITLRMNAKLHEKLQQHTEANDITYSQLIRRLLKDYLN